MYSQIPKENWPIDSSEKILNEYKKKLSAQSGRSYLNIDSSFAGILEEHIYSQEITRQLVLQNDAVDIERDSRNKLIVN